MRLGNPILLKSIAERNRRYSTTIEISDDSEIAETLGQNESSRIRVIRARAAIALNQAILNSKEDDWRGIKLKERKVRQAMAKVVAEEFGDHAVDVDALFELVKNQHEY